MAQDMAHVQTLPVVVETQTQPAIRNDYTMAGAYRYRPGPPLSVPTTVLTGDADPNVTIEDARRWSEVIGEPCALNVLPGGHSAPERTSSGRDTPRRAMPSIIVCRASLTSLHSVVISAIL